MHRGASDDHIKMDLTRLISVCSFVLSYAAHTSWCPGLYSAEHITWLWAKLHLLIIMENLTDGPELATCDDAAGISLSLS